MFKPAAIICAITIGVLALLESMARIVEIWVPPQAMDYGLGFEPGSRLFIPSPEDPSVLITHPAKELSFQKQRFSLRKAPGTLRIFALGGSSINYLGKGLYGLDVRLQQAFGHRFRRVETINAGGLSYGSQRLVAGILKNRELTGQFLS